MQSEHREGLWSLVSSRITADDVARRVGVSRSTVSRAFTPESFVAPRTRARILAAAEELGYRPNAIARALISRKSGIVAIVLGDLVNPFHAVLLEQLTEQLQAGGLIPITVKTGPEQPIEDVLPTLVQYQVGAVVITSMIVTRSMVEACRHAGLPVVLLNRVVYGADAIAICADHEQGGRLAAEHLAGLGYRRVALIQGSPGTWTGQARETGFRRGLAETRLEPAAVVPGDYTYAGGAAAAERLFGVEPAPEAVLGANDLTALGLIDAARARFGLNVPDDLAVVGFDDIPMTEWTAYDLTTVHLPVKRMLDACCRLLRELLDGAPFIPSTTLIPCRLVIRGSTRAAEVSAARPDLPRARHGEVTEPSPTARNALTDLRHCNLKNIGFSGA